MTREPFIAHSELTNEIYIVVGKEKYRVTEQAIKAVMAIKEPCEDEDIMTIHTQGLDEGIRCAMCTNSMKSDRGCDGGCVVNEAMYKEVMNTIRNHIVPSVTPTRKKGKWIVLKDEYGDICEAICSCCGDNGNHRWKYCHTCGAEMEGEEWK